MALRRQLSVMAMLLGSTAAVLAQPLEPEAVKLDEERLAPGLYPAAPVPEQFAIPSPLGQPPLDLDWSVGLRGSFTSATTGERFVTTLTPQFTATYDGRRLDLGIEGSADLTRDGGGDIGLTGLRLGLSGRSPLDSATTATGSANLVLTQEPAGSLDLNPLVTVAPQVITGSLGAEIDRQFGKFNLGLRLDGERVINGTSTRLDTGVTDNSDQDYWGGDASLRLGFQATPIFEVFGQAGIGRDVFDAPSTSLGVRQDATDRSVRAGIAGNWNSVLSASASVGVGERVFDDPSLDGVTTQLYDASITYRPDPTLSLTAAVSTTITPTGADAAGTARVDRSVTAKIDYTVNSWLRMRASADWGLAEFAATTETERRQGLGAGADYALNAHTALSADYGYTQRENSLSGLSEAHRVTVGITVRR